MMLAREAIRRHPLFTTLLLYFVNTFGILLVEIPTVRLIEQSICRRYYRKTSSSGNLISELDNGENLCKIRQVQSTLSYVVGWKIACDALPGL